jgi:hypothetical protein
MGYEGLQKQTLEVRIGGGLDQHNEPFLVDAPSLLGSDNTRVAHDGAIGKRNGAQLGATSGLPTATGTPPVCVIDQGGSLAMHHAEGTYQLDETRSNWRKTNELAPRVSKVLVDSLVRTNNSLRFCDVAVSGSLVCSVWYDDEASCLFYAFFDAETLATIAGPTKLVSANLDYWPRLIAFDPSGGVARRFAIVGTNRVNTGVYCSVYQVSVGNYTFPAPVSVGSYNHPSIIGSVMHDVCESATAGNFTVCFPNNGNTIINDIGPTGTVVATQTATGFYARSISYNAPLNSLVMPGLFSPGFLYTGKLARMPADYSAAPTLSSLHTPTGTDSEAVTIAVEQQDGRMVLFSDYDVVRISSSYVKTSEGTHNYEPIAKASYLYASTGVEECVCLCTGTTSETITGLRSSAPGATVGAMFPAQNALSELTLGHRSACLTDSVYHYDETFSTPVPVYSLRHLSSSPFVGRQAWNVVPVATGIRSASTDGIYKLQIDAVRSNYIVPGTLTSATANGISLTASGCGVTCLDSQQHAELMPPMPLAGGVMQGADTSLSHGGTVWPYGYSDPSNPLASKTMRYVLMYVWTDGRGNKHRSPPSADVVVEQDIGLGRQFGGVLYSAGSPYYPPRIFLEKPRFNALNGDRTTLLEVEVYAGNPFDTSILYLLGTCEPKELDSRTDYIAICWDAAGFDTLVSYSVWTHDGDGFSTPAPIETLGLPLYYGTTGELEPSRAPALLDMCSTQSRLWALSAENRYQVWPSKPLVAGIAPEFSADLVTTIPADGGPCVAVAALDDKVVVFKQDRIFVLFGDPGLADGSQSSLQPARLISSDVGADSPASVVEGPFGICFNSARGIMLLDRGLALTPIGERVLESTSGLVVTSGTLVPGETEVRWTLDSNGYSLATSTAVVWNYKHNTWHSYSTFPTSCATVWNGDFARFGANGLPYIETPGTWTAADTANSVLTTAWIRPGGLQGFMRLWRILLIGRWFTGWLKVEIGYNYEDAWKESRQWTATELTSFSTRGQRLQVRIAPSEQKIESFRLRITERATVTQPEGASDTGRGFEWVAIQLEAGIKRGGFKQLVAAAKR